MYIYIHNDIFIISAYTWFRYQKVNNGYQVVQLSSRTYSSCTMEPLLCALKYVNRSHVYCSYQKQTYKNKIKPHEPKKK